MGMQWINHNGNIVSHGGLIISPSNRAFRYGDGIFESIRFANGIPLWMQYHWERLTRSLKVLQISIPESWDEGFFSNQIILLCQKNQFVNARIRLNIFRQDGGFYKPEVNDGSFLIEASPIQHPQYQLNEKGVLLETYTQITKSRNILSALKTNNALPNVMAANYAKSKNADDAILLNDSGNIAEATSSNIFIVKNGKYYTPSIEEACVDGVMRRVIMEMAAIHQIQMYDCALSLNDLLDADEIFLTNAICGMKWVLGFKNKRYYHQNSGRLMSLLNSVTFPEAV